MRRIPMLVLVALLVGCSGGDGSDDEASPSSTPAAGERPARFCDVYLDYIQDPTDANLSTVAEVGGSDFAEPAEIVRTAGATREVIAAIETLDQLARNECQAEWIGGAQGAGTTAGAAEAFFDALVNGDRFGALNVASANAIARFEPWAPIERDEELDTPAIASVDADTFTMVLDAETLAQCYVETGVVITCDVLRGDETVG